MSAPATAEPAPGGPALGEIPHVGHIAALDGLRGLAILMVMLFHQADFVAATPFQRVAAVAIGQGQAGVDLFFVLSGFLITGILVESRGSPRYYRNFYARRFLRIFPLYYAVLFAAFVIIPHWLPSLQKAKWSHATGVNQLWYWSYLSNWYIAIWTAGPTHGMVDLSWSLSIEEQFYLAWPWVVASCSRRGLLRVCVALIAAGPIFRLATVAAGAPLTWPTFLTPSKLDALGVGAGLALLAREGRSTSWMRPAALRVLPTALAGAVASAIAFEAGRPWSSASVVLGPLALAVLFGSMLVVVTSERPGSAVARAFGGGVLAMLGAYSYALYLFHNPIQAAIRDRVVSAPALARMGLGTLGGQAAFSVLATLPALACAWLSWHLFEGPILRLKRFFPSGRGRAPAAFDAPAPAPAAEASR
jgi:peptidoglycan/LPS O-acetylase OafA/YrhL